MTTVDITDLINSATAESRDQPDVALSIEISDRINNSEPQYRFSLPQHRKNFSQVYSSYKEID